MKNTSIWKWACLILIPNTLLSIYTLRWVNHTQEVKQQIEVCLRLISDAETSARGYLVARGDTRFLDHYNFAAQNYQREIGRLAALTEDNPTQVRNVALLRKAADAKMDIIKEGIALSGKSEFDRSSQMINRGKELMDDYRDKVGVMQREEDALLVKRARNSVWVHRWMLSTVCVVFFAVMAQASIEFYERSVLAARIHEEPSPA